MKKGKFVAILYMLGILAALISSRGNATNSDADLDVQSAVIQSDHEARAEYHEDTARAMQAKAWGGKLLLEQYESKSYLYGKQAQDLQARTHALIRKYSKAANASMREAALHRQLAIQLETDSFCIRPEKTELC